jgi:hypothetical protein
VSALERIATLQADPWSGYWKKPQPLAAAMGKLGFAPRD